MTGGRRVRLDQLIEGLTDAVVVVDATGEIVLVNASTEQLFGYDRTELIGRPVELLLPEALHDLHRGHRAGYMLEPRNRSMGSGLDLTARRKEGGDVPVEIGLSAVQTDEGMLIAAVITNVTERRRLEEALVQTQKLEAVGRLAGGIAHDFNNLLTAILGYTEFLTAELEEGTRQHADAREVRAAAERASGLTRQLLVFSRSQTIEPQVINPNERVLELQGLLARLIGESIEVESRLEHGLWPVLIDPGQFEQIVTNLVLNARDAMPYGGQLTIETKKAHLDEGWTELDSGEYVALSISDTGEGMDEQVLARALEPFYTTKPPGKGTGLGLATVYGIVEQAGGDLRLYSEPGVGTTVKVYLPRAVGKVAAPGLAETEHEELEVPLTTRAVLLVEDETAVRSLVSRMLRSLGYDAIVAASAAEAVGLFDLHREEIGALLTDVVMPQIGGRELAERLLQTDPSLPVLFMSGYTEDALLRRRTLAARFSFIEKPFTARQLGYALQRLLGASRP
ncbi:MAG TPA: ATP-binding protein [Gaiellaceae bacterium]|nr:ATP-binding protein [Gaiellaceae bacterium]